MASGNSRSTAQAMAVAIRAKSRASMRTNPKRKAAPQYFLLRMKSRESMSGLTGADCDGRN